MILEFLFTGLLVFGGGQGEVLDPSVATEVVPYENPTPPFKEALAYWSEPQPEPPSRGVWYELAVCETGRGGEPTWDYDESRYNWGSGIFDGGLQFLPSTWTAFKPDSYPSHAYLATPAQQITVGKEVARAQGAGAWPSCTAKLGITTKDLLND